jgi:carboxymethylenebutenolidase
MPIYEPKHIEYNIASSLISVNMDHGEQFPAYWAYPQLGGKYPAVALLHDWWGLTDMVRRLGNLLAQSGYFVIVPDLFDGHIAVNPKDAIVMVESLGEKNGMERIRAAIDVVEHHHQTNRYTAVVGLGMGGSFAFDMAVSRTDIEAVIALAGFPQRNLGRFMACNVPVLAMYGGEEPHVKAPVIERLRKELAQSPAAAQHEVAVVDGLGHDFFSEAFDDTLKNQSRIALDHMLRFLKKHLMPPTQRHQTKTY